MRKKTKSLILGLVIGLSLAMMSCGAFYYYYEYIRLPQVVSQYNQLIQDYQHPVTVTAFKYTSNFEANETLNDLSVEAVEVPLHLASEGLATDLDSVINFKTNGQVTQGDLVYFKDLYTPLSLANDLRKYEIGHLFTHSSLKQHDVVDVRISFPSGLDYVVLSKKSLVDVKRLQQGEQVKEVCLFHLNADEILRLSSATVDAFLHEGTYLYTTEYVDAKIQSPAVVTYPTNEDVRQLILADPNIIERAEGALVASKRQALDASLSHLPSDQKRVLPQHSILEPVAETKDDSSLENTD